VFFGLFKHFFAGVVEAKNGKPQKKPRVTPSKEDIKRSGFINFFKLVECIVLRYFGPQIGKPYWRLRKLIRKGGLLGMAARSKYVEEDGPEGGKLMTQSIMRLKKLINTRD